MSADKTTELEKAHRVTETGNNSEKALVVPETLKKA
jgi:hypothetical protein